MSVAHRVRQQCLPTIDSLVDPIGLYTTYRLPTEEFIAAYSFENGLADAVTFLSNRGFEQIQLSSLKYHPSRRVSEDGSFRRVPDEHPDINARITEEWTPEECQHHVHVFETGDQTVELYSHYELRPDMLTPTVSLQRLRTHYLPEPGEEYVPSVTPPRLEPSVIAAYD